MGNPARAITTAVVIGACASCAGCAGKGVSDYAQTYPERKTVAPAVDIQVEREETHVRLTNTTPRSYGRSTLWLNQWFSRPIKGLGVGETLRLPLVEFVDMHSESYRGGGFFATRAPDALVSAHLETDEAMVPLIVVRNRDE